MKICEKYSHLNGLEFLLVHKPGLWREIKDVIERVDAEKCRTKVSKEKTMKGRVLYSPIEINNRFKTFLHKRAWKESRVSYWVTKSEKLIRKTLALPLRNRRKKSKRPAKCRSSVIIRPIS